MTMIRDKARNYITTVLGRDSFIDINKNEQCSICEKNIPNSSLLVRHVESNKIICLFCICDIAETK